MFRRITQGVVLAGAMALFFGCATTDTTKVSTDGFQKSAKTGDVQAKDLLAGNQVEVSVEVDGTMEVSVHRAELTHQGLVTLPLVGDVKIGGMKLAAARDVIAKTYGAYYVHPPVVMLAMVDEDVSGEWGFITVLGRGVSKPGQVPLQSQKGMNLSSAIQLAGGFAPSAKQSDVQVTRIDADGKKLRVSIDFRQIGQAGNADADICI